MPSLLGTLIISCQVYLSRTLTIKLGINMILINKKRQT
ncbi:hypothetical protein QEW_0460 [Clostridioides difficile CD160]|nr:hypothetical protein QEW_0460 [Clostridioides difficile CD160]